MSKMIFPSVTRSDPRSDLIRNLKVRLLTSDFCFVPSGLFFLILSSNKFQTSHLTRLRRQQALPCPALDLTRSNHSNLSSKLWQWTLSLAMVHINMCFSFTGSPTEMQRLSKQQQETTIQALIFFLWNSETQCNAYTFTCWKVFSHHQDYWCQNKQ